jgi:hypothetical protein
MTTYQINWYKKSKPGPGRYAFVGTERFDLFSTATERAKDLLESGHRVQFLPLEVTK